MSDRACSTPPSVNQRLCYPSPTSPAQRTPTTPLAVPHSLHTAESPIGYAHAGQRPRFTTGARGLIGSQPRSGRAVGLQRVAPSGALEADPLAWAVLTDRIDNEPSSEPGMSLGSVRGVGLVGPPLAILMSRSWKRRPDDHLDFWKRQRHSVGLCSAQMRGQRVVLGHGSRPGAA